MEATLVQNAWKKAALAIAVGLALVPCYSMAGPLPVNSATNAAGAVTPDIDGGNPIRCEAIGTHSGTSGPMITPAYERARAFLGSTPEEIQQNFAAIQEMNFATGNAKTIVSHLSDKELKDLAARYDQTAPAGDNDLLRVMATKLDTESLIRVAKAFGSNATQIAVQKYAPANVKESFRKQLAITPNVPAMASALSSMAVFSGPRTMASPTPDMTLRDIYLEFRTAPIGSLTPASALEETAIYAGSRLVWAWGVGYAFGTGVHYLIENYDPSLDDVIGGTIQTMIDDVGTATTEFEQGNFESGIDSLFGTSLSSGGNYDGDWDVSESFGFYESSGGGDGSC